MNMIEKVVRAIEKSRIDCYGSDIDMAKAAIEAIR